LAKSGSSRRSTANLRLPKPVADLRSELADDILLHAIARHPEAHERLGEPADYDGNALFEHACRLGLEGIVAKKRAARYRSGTCRSWVKVKNPAYERR
jgi:ATP-dependent DNA ligase